MAAAVATTAGIVFYLLSETIQTERERADRAETKVQELERLLVDRDTHYLENRTIERRELVMPTSTPTPTPTPRPPTPNTPVSSPPPPSIPPAPPAPTVPVPAPPEPEVGPLSRLLANILGGS